MRKLKPPVAALVLLLFVQPLTPVLARMPYPSYFSHPPYAYANMNFQSNYQVYPENIPPATYSVWSSDMVGQREIYTREEGLDMRGVIPEILPDYGGAGLFLNDLIDNAINARVRAAKDARAKSIFFKYTIYSDPQMVSIILLSQVTSATSKTEVDSINFNPETGEPIENLSDVLSFDIIPLAEKILKEQIRRNPERYNAAFDTSRLAEQPFYLTEDSAVLLFDEFELSSAADGVNELELRLDLNQINHVSVSRMEYHKSPVYSLKMVPLKKICEGLGYTVEWDAASGRAYIYQNGMLASHVTPGVNSYEETDERTRTLETAPELMTGIMYVPISFFDQILRGITYTVDENEDIMFMRYVG